MNTEKWIIGFILSMCFILFGGISVVTAMESMQLGYRILDRNTTEEIVVDGTPEIMNLKLHDRDNNEFEISRIKYLQSSDAIYNIDKIEAKERLETKWIYLRKGQKVFFKMYAYDTTNESTKNRKLRAGIIDYSKHIKYVENNEEIAYIFKIPKNGKYQCYVYNCSDFKTQLLGEIEILND